VSVAGFVYRTTTNTCVKPNVSRGSTRGRSCLHFHESIRRWGVASSIPKLDTSEANHQQCSGAVPAARDVQRTTYPDPATRRRQNAACRHRRGETRRGRLHSALGHSSKTRLTFISRWDSTKHRSRQYARSLSRIFLLMEAGLQRKWRMMS
jgi:hypothetical protein